MSKKLEYTATNMARKFWLQEMIIGANLKYEGYTDKDIRKKSVEDNIFQGRSENFRRETASGIILRLNTLDEYLINLLSNCNLEVAKQIIIYSIMKSDKLFFDFMNEIYKDKIILKDFKIKSVDLKVFISRKQEQVPKIAAWKNSTIERLKNNYIGYLIEAGFIVKEKENLEIIIPIIDKQLQDHIIEIGDKIYLQAMIGEI